MNDRQPKSITDLSRYPDPEAMPEPRPHISYVPRNEAEEIAELLPIMPIEIMAEVASPAGILAQEARGAVEMVNSTTIPIKGSSKPEEMEKLIDLGFNLGGIADDLFRHCELPEGWSRETSGHSMWTHIVDERGFRRVAIFYKAAFYDRSAHMHVESNPCTGAQSDAYEDFSKGHSYNDGWTFGQMMDGDIQIYMAGKCQFDENGDRIYIQGRAGHDGEWIDGDWQLTGEVFERHIAPDGTVIYEAEYRV